MHELKAPLAEAWQDVVADPTTLHILAELDLVRLFPIDLSSARPLLRILFPTSVVVCRERNPGFGGIVEIEECSGVFECSIDQFGGDLVIDNTKEAIVFGG